MPLRPVRRGPAVIYATSLMYAIWGLIIILSDKGCRVWSVQWVRGVMPNCATAGAVFTACGIAGLIGVTWFHGVRVGAMLKTPLLALVWASALSSLTGILAGHDGYGMPIPREALAVGLLPNIVICASFTAAYLKVYRLGVLEWK